MFRRFILGFLLIFSGLTFAQTMEKISLDEGHFEFELPDYCTPLPESFMEAIRPLNEFIIYGTSCSRDQNQALVSVSKYSGDSPLSIEEIFINSVNTVAHTSWGDVSSNYRLVQYKTYEKDGRTLRYKISLKDGETFNIMFYFMENDFSNHFFELKGTTNHNALVDTFKLLEKAALSAGFK